MRWIRTFVYGIALVLLASNLILGYLAPNCNIISGPCSENWASGPHLVSLLAAFYFAPVVAGFILYDLWRSILLWHRRRTTLPL